MCPQILNTFNVDFVEEESEIIFSLDTAWVLTAKEKSSGIHKLNYVLSHWKIEIIVVKPLKDHGILNTGVIWLLVCIVRCKFNLDE